MSKENTSLGRKGLIGLALAMAASQPALAAVVEGRVTDASGTVGLEGAIVEVDGTGLVATTDRTGAYRIVGAPAGDVNLTVSYLGAMDVTSAITLESDDSVASLNFVVGTDVRVLDNVLVSGQRGALFSSINRQRSSDTLISVLTADVIGSLPDENVAESARRIPGVSVQNDQGEGRFITIRGLDPSFNAYSVNGVRLPAPEGDVRAVALDVIDSDVLNAITIQKSLTPDMDGDGIGGSIDIETLSAFDRDGRYLRIKAEGIYSEITEAWGEKIGVTASDTFLNDKLGIAGNVTWNRRDFGSDNFENGGEVLGPGQLQRYPEELEFRDYQIERERLSATLNFDYRLNESTDLYVRTLFNEFSDLEFRSRNEFKLDDAEFLGTVNRDGATIAQFGFGDEIEVDRDIKDRLEEQTIWSVQTGGETVVGATTFEYGVSYSFAEEAEPDRIDATWRADDADDVDPNPLLELDITDPLRPFVSGGSVATVGYYFSPENFEFDELEFLNGVTDDEEWAGFLDIQRDTDVFGAPGFIKGGVKVRVRTKTRDVDVDVFDGFDGPDLLLSDFDAPIDYDLFPIQPVPNAGLVRGFFNANRSSFELNDEDTLINSTVEDYVADENIYAAYLMGQANFSSGLRVTGGVRVEATDFSAVGRALNEDVPNLATGDDVTVFDVKDRNSYVDWLPSVNARYEVNDNVIVRGAYYRSVARPNFSDAVPAIEINEDLEGSAGNPELERQVADNFDIGLEIYPSDNAAFSVSVFHKNIDDYIAVAQFDNFEVAGVLFTEVDLPVNLAEAEITGVEFAYQNVFEGLPSPFDGLLAIASWTFQDGSANFGSESIQLPRLSENVGSLIIGYDKYGLDLRAALSYRSEYLDELGDGGEALNGTRIDRFESDYLRLDLMAQYDITDQFEIQLEVNNVNDEPAEYFFEDGGTRRLSQFEEYGRTVRVGVRYRY